MAKLEDTGLNVIMVTLDAVRPDHLGCYGYQGAETPNLDSLASRSILYEQAVTHAPNTWVSHATLFTGCLPARHTLRAPTHRLSSELATLAEWLRSQGYATAAFPGTTLLGRPQGFHRGFDWFDESWQREGLRAKDILWRRTWNTVLDHAETWMSGNRRPFFVWFHYVDTHHLPHYELPDYFRMSLSPRWQHYDGKIAYADQTCIGRIQEFLNRTGLDERTIWIVFSDHGEELLEDDRAVHDGDLRDEVIRVPLIMSLPPCINRTPARISSQVRLMDLYPTICDLLGIAQPSIQGRPLPLDPGEAPLRQGRDAEAYLENWPKGCVGIRTSEWKLILRYVEPSTCRSNDPMAAELYHLPTDPQERLVVSSKHPAVLDYLKASCLEAAKPSVSRSLSPEEKERVEMALKALGYL